MDGGRYVTHILQPVASLEFQTANSYVVEGRGRAYPSVTSDIKVTEAEHTVTSTFSF